MLLIPGRQYRIDHPILESRLGAFIQYHGKEWKEFNHIIHPTFKESPGTRLTIGEEWTVRESAKTRVFNQAANTLADIIPEDTVGIIEAFVLGPREKGSGTYRISPYAKTR